MTKTFKFYVVIWSICFVVFNAIAFINPVTVNTITGSFLIGYVFIVFSFLGQLTTGYMVFKDTNFHKMFYNISLLVISYICLILMLLVGMLCMLGPFYSIRIAAITCIIITGFSAIITLTTCGTIKIVSKIDGEIETKTYTIKLLTSEAQHLMNSATSDEMKILGKKVYEALRYSDPMSNISLFEIGEQIQRQFSTFKEAVNSEDLEYASTVSDELLNLIDIRNNKCKFLK